MVSSCGVNAEAPNAELLLVVFLQIWGPLYIRRGRALLALGFLFFPYQLISYNTSLSPLPIRHCRPIDKMATNDNTSSPNGVATTSRFDPEFTQKVIEATGPKATPRTRKVMASLIRHVHDFARENELTVDEWMAGVEMMNRAGRMSDDKRNEGQLLCDVIGLES